MVQFRSKPVMIDAMNNDGTDESALALAEWVLDGGGAAKLYPIGTVEDDPHHAYVVVYQDDMHATLGPGHWAYRYSAHGVLFLATAEQFESMWELSFSLGSLLKGEIFDDSTRVLERHHGKADPSDGLGRHGGAGSAGQREGGEQSGDRQPATDQLSVVFSSRESV